MNYNITPAFSIIVITILSIIITSRIKERTYNHPLEGRDRFTFKVSKWTYVITTIGTIFFAILLIGSAYYMFPRKGMHPTNVGLILVGLISLGIGIYENYRCYKTYVLINDGVLTYHDGKKIKIRVDLKNIKSVRVFQMYIVIDVGEKRNKLIPVYFKDVAKLVSIVQSSVKITGGQQFY